MEPTVEERIAYETQIELIFQAAANGAMLLTHRDSNNMMNAVKTWCLEKLVASIQVNDEWVDLEWQISMINSAFCKWWDD